jgi:hypothetical protein
MRHASRKPRITARGARRRLEDVRDLNLEV